MSARKESQKFQRLQRSNSSKVPLLPRRCDVPRLIEKYGQEDGWLCPLPWEPKMRFDPDEVCTKLRSATRHSARRNSQPGPKVKLEDVFDTAQVENKALRVLVTGATGSGKTLLCQRVVFSWSREETVFRALPAYTTLPVYFKLRQVEPQNQLEDQLFDFVQSYYNQDEEPEEDLKEILRGFGENLLLILDGFDEADYITQRKVKRLVSQENEESVFAFSSILVTSKDTSEKEFLDLFHRRLNIARLSGKRVEKLVKCVNKNYAWKFAEYQSDKRRSSSILQSHPATREIEEGFYMQFGQKLKLIEMTPLIITAMCWLVKQPNIPLKGWNTVFTCVHNLTKRCNKREAFGLSSDAIGDVLWRLGLMCFQQEQLFIPDSVLRDIFGPQYLFLTLSGILKNVPQTDKVEEHWSVAHKSFSEALVNRLVHQNLNKSLYNQFSVARSYANSEVYVHYDAGRITKSEMMVEDVCGERIYFTWDQEENGFQKAFDKTQHLNSVVRRYFDLLGIFKPEGMFVMNITFDGYDEASVDELVYPGGESLLVTLLNINTTCKIFLSAVDGLDLSTICYRIMAKMFGVVEDDVPRAGPRSYFEKAVQHYNKTRDRHMEVLIRYKKNGVCLSYFVNIDNVSDYDWTDAEEVNFTILKMMTLKREVS